MNDSVELVLDGDRVPNDIQSNNAAGNREGFQLIADPIGNRFSSAPDVGVMSWKVGTARNEDGYVIEFEIPLDLIDTQDGPGVRPSATGSELWMNLTINDVDGAVNNQTSFGMLWSEDRLWSPLYGGEDFWPAPCCGCAHPNPLIGGIPVRNTLQCSRRMTDSVILGPASVYDSTDFVVIAGRLYL